MIRERGEPQGYPLNAVRICIDRYRNYDVEGRIYSRLQQEPILFRNCGEMLLKADYIFDERGFPQTFQQRRCFGENRRVTYRKPRNILPNDASILEQRGSFGTYDVIVRSRKKSSWQGIFRKRDGTRTEEFQSEMELLNCIWDEVLNKKTTNSS